MAIDKETVRHVARLARLELDEADLERTTRELSRVLEYVEQLDALGLDEVEPLETVHEAFPPPRADEPRPSGLTRDEVLAQAPASDGTYFLVPPVVEYPES